ncbi:MAG: bifunctional DNA-formamidopyrimidine glycosylase/DNA-(apurinic or apyrimidinic site) lyase [Candidatus Nealsonbacteria bacterium]|nr:bifunctional DNA-formamidopyrimidine glycosylase/DNA-(apurinic or apyrimidinic site) lyase [Candidatus Nealsonbacteria bacterium]
MPELPEVETTVRSLRKKILGRRIKDVWTDAEKLVKKPESFSDFEREIKNREIKSVSRRAKFIFLGLSGDKKLLVHQKMSGHLLVGEWQRDNGEWASKSRGSLQNDPYNQYIHIIFFLDDGTQLALSTLRKFSKVELWDADELEESKQIKKLGPEPLSKNFDFESFQQALGKRKSGKIKQVLMDQRVIAGIGNIYANEILWEAKVNPFKDFTKLSEKELRDIFKAIKKVLKKGIELQGASYSDYRKPSGKKGEFQDWGRVYDREGEDCPRCRSKIKRKKIGGRSAYFCPHCQD